MQMKIFIGSYHEDTSMKALRKKMERIALDYVFYDIRLWGDIVW